MCLNSGLYKLFHTAIPEGRTWSKLGEHEEHRQYKGGKHQPGDLKHSIQNNLFVTQNTLFGNQMTQNTLFYGFYADGSKNPNIHARKTSSLQ